MDLEGLRSTSWSDYNILLWEWVMHLGLTCNSNIDLAHLYTDLQLAQEQICYDISFRPTSAEGVLSSSQFIQNDLPLPAIMMDIEWKSWGDFPFNSASPPGKTNCRALMNGIKEEKFQIKEKPQSLLLKAPLELWDFIYCCSCFSSIFMWVSCFSRPLRWLVNCDFSV